MVYTGGSADDSTTWTASWASGAAYVPGASVNTALCWWPYDYLPALSLPPPTYQIISAAPSPPTTCAGALHVFPCPHCRTCVCGAATLSAKA